MIAYEILPDETPALAPVEERRWYRHLMPDSERLLREAIDNEIHESLRVLRHSRRVLRATGFEHFRARTEREIRETKRHLRSLFAFRRTGLGG